jgi:hypothetical protein
MSVIMPGKAAARWWGIKVPKHILYYYHNEEGYHFPGTKPEWKTYTIYDHIRKKTEKQNRNLATKRRYHRIVPCYICLCKFSENGCRHIRIQTVRFNEYPNERLCETIRQRHNCGVFPEMTELWEEAFFRLYKTNPKGDELFRAVKFTKCIVDNYNRLIDVL